MFLMRRAKPEDAPTLLKLARMVHFINLPADKDIIADKVQWSRNCFKDLSRRIKPDGSLAPHASPRTLKPRTPGLQDFRTSGLRTEDPGHKAQPSYSGLADLTNRSKMFMFTLEDTESRGVLGTSQIITSMGGPGQPNLCFELSRKEMFSTSLQIGSTHTVAKLKLDESGPTEIGGLILQPSSRGHRAHLGRFLSLIRFHFMGLYRPVVSDRVIAEMMGPITPDGQNTLWEYLGRRFINLTYIEADRFCQYSKEFMLSLLPREEIYLTLLPPEARRIIGQVGPETEPARRMLENLGFEYRNCVDPFDGGPMLEARTDAISVVKSTRRMTVGEPLSANAQTAPSAPTAMLSTLAEDGEFLAIQGAFALDGKDRLRMSREDMESLQATPGSFVGFTPLPRRAEEKTRSSPPESDRVAAIRNGHAPGGPTRKGAKKHRPRTQGSKT